MSKTNSEKLAASVFEWMTKDRMRNEDYAISVCGSKIKVAFQGINQNPREDWKRVKFHYATGSFQFSVDESGALCDHVIVYGENTMEVIESGSDPSVKGFKSSYVFQSSDRDEQVEEGAEFVEKHIAEMYMEVAERVFGINMRIESLIAEFNDPSKQNAPSCASVIETKVDLGEGEVKLLATVGILKVLSSIQIDRTCGMKIIGGPNQESDRFAETEWADVYLVDASRRLTRADLFEVGYAIGKKAVPFVFGREAVGSTPMAHSCVIVLGGLEDAKKLVLTTHGNPIACAAMAVNGKIADEDTVKKMTSGGWDD